MNNNIEPEIVAAIISAIAAIIAAWLPIIKRKTRVILSISIIIVGILFIIIFKTVRDKESFIYAEIKTGLNSPPVFHKSSSVYDDISWSVVIKIVSNSDSDVVIQDVLASFKSSAGLNVRAISNSRPEIESFSDIDDFMKDNLNLLQYPFIIKSKSELYLHVNFNVLLLNSSGRQIKYKFLAKGYELLPLIMTNPSIKLVLIEGSEIKVDMEEYSPLFVGQKINVSLGIISEVWETSYGNIGTHTSQLDDFGIYWKSHVRLKEESGKEVKREWFNRLPNYENQNLEDTVFVFSEIVPFVKISHYGTNPLELFAVGFTENDTLSLFRYLPNELHLIEITKISLHKRRNDKKDYIIFYLPEEIINSDNMYILNFSKDDRNLIWPFKIFHIDFLLPRSR